MSVCVLLFYRVGSLPERGSLKGLIQLLSEVLHHMIYKCHGSSHVMLLYYIMYCTHSNSIFDQTIQATHVSAHVSACVLHQVLLLSTGINKSKNTFCAVAINHEMMCVLFPPAAQQCTPNPSTPQSIVKLVEDIDALREALSCTDLQVLKSLIGIRDILALCNI